MNKKITLTLIRVCPKCYGVRRTRYTTAQDIKFFDNSVNPGRCKCGHEYKPTYMSIPSELVSFQRGPTFWERILTYLRSS